MKELETHLQQPTWFITLAKQSGFDRVSSNVHIKKIQIKKCENSTSFEAAKNHDNQNRTLTFRSPQWTPHCKLNIPCVFIPYAFQCWKQKSYEDVISFRHRHTSLVSDVGRSKDRLIGEAGRGLLRGLILRESVPSNLLSICAGPQWFGSKQRRCSLNGKF